MNAAVGAAAGAGAAAAAHQAMLHEEEELTMGDYDGEWEYKFLRSATGAFRNPEKFQQALEDESVAGWELVEKFDHQRIRLRRHISARDMDPGLDFDPYRTALGATDAKIAVMILVGIFASIGVFILLMLLAN